MKDHIVGRLTRLSDWYWGAPGSGLRRLEVTPRPSTSTSSSPLRWFDDQHNNNKPSLMGMRRWLISLIPIQHPESSHSLLMQRVEVRMTILWKDLLAIGNWGIPNLIKQLPKRSRWLIAKYQEVLANHDSDGDGKISRKEYTSHMFRLATCDHDGWILYSKAQFKMSI